MELYFFITLKKKIKDRLVRVRVVVPLSPGTQASDVFLLYRS